MSTKDDGDHSEPTNKTPSHSATQTTPQGNSTSQLFDLRTSKGQILFLIITVLISCCIQLLPTDYITNFLPKTLQSTSISLKCNNTNTQTSNTPAILSPKYAIYENTGNDAMLRHVKAIFQRMGYEQVPFENEHWDVLWAHAYPFREQERRMKNLKTHQKVNHFPGSGYITSKLELSTTQLSYIPRSFKLPTQKDEFLKYSRENPGKLFVEKNNEHRHIYVRSIEVIDLNSTETFIQEFIDNPFLVDGYKFDIGVYVIVTSIDPLRVYIYKGDVLFRYCPVKYYPFDVKIVDKYVVGDDYLPTWEVPSLSPFYNELGLGMKDSFDAYVRSLDRNPDIIWKDVADAIRSIILIKEKNIINALKNYKNTRNFFEMMRFDLMIDDELKVHLVEANMSPNLSSAHFKPNALLYEQVIYSMLNLVGIGAPIHRSSLKRRPKNIEEMVSAEKNIAVDGEICTQSPCTESCDEVQCKLCKPCWTQDLVESLHAAYREHIHRADTKRIFPVPITNTTTYSLDKFTKDLTISNQLITRWFYGKCRMDSTWCT